VSWNVVPADEELTDMRIVVALGGNALLQRGERPDADAQTGRLAAVGGALRSLAAEDDLVITHGNGPQVGLLAAESEADPILHSAYPLDAIGAQTQGLIGYWLLEELDRADTARATVAVITRVLVDAYDPAFSAPSKFVGPVYTERQARKLSARHGWPVGRDGDMWRRVVASPRPITVLELPAIADLLSSGNTVVCGGGGGVPVASDDDGVLRGVPAVIDKDHTAALLAIELRADRLVLLTDVDGVYVNFGTPHAELLRSATTEQLRSMTIAAGSMGPKVEAACSFAEATGATATIGSLADMIRVVSGEAGTAVLAEAPGPTVGAPPPVAVSAEAPGRVPR
jgi:carbamate kinase